MAQSGFARVCARARDKPGSGDGGRWGRENIEMESRGHVSAKSDLEVERDGRDGPPERTPARGKGQRRRGKRQRDKETRPFVPFNDIENFAVPAASGKKKIEKERRLV